MVLLLITIMYRVGWVAQKSMLFIIIKQLCLLKFKILQGSAVAQTVLGGLTINIQLLISCSAYVPKIMKVGCQYRQSWNTIASPIFGGLHPQFGKKQKLSL